MFDLIICLTQETRKDRQRAVKREFKNLGVDPEWFYAIPSIGRHESFNLSQKAILEKFIESGKETLLCFEDDMCVVNKQGLCGKKDLPDDWDVLYLGANILGNTEKVTANLFRIENVRTTHAIAYTRKAALKILIDFPHESSIMYDEYISNLELNRFVLNPMVCWQSPGHSDIWERQVNYNREFRESQKKLNNG